MDRNFRSLPEIKFGDGPTNRNHRRTALLLACITMLLLIGGTAIAGIQHTLATIKTPISTVLPCQTTQTTAVLTQADQPEAANNADTLARFQLTPVIWQLMPRSGNGYRAQMARVPLNMIYLLLAALLALHLSRPSVRFYLELLVLFHFQCLLKSALPVRAGPFIG